MALRNPDVEVEADLTPHSRALVHVHLETWLGKLCHLRYPWWGTNRCAYHPVFWVDVGGNCYLRAIPARVRFGLFKKSGFGSEGNSFENIYGAEIANRDILSLNTPAFGLNMARWRDERNTDL